MAAAWNRQRRWVPPSCFVDGPEAKTGIFGHLALLSPLREAEIRATISAQVQLPHTANQQVRVPPDRPPPDLDLSQVSEGGSSRQLEVSGHEGDGLTKDDESRLQVGKPGGQGRVRKVLRQRFTELQAS